MLRRRYRALGGGKRKGSWREEESRGELMYDDGRRAFECP
jgi:hypothetical protein